MIKIDHPGWAGPNSSAPSDWRAAWTNDRSSLTCAGYVICWRRCGPAPRAAAMLGCLSATQASSRKMNLRPRWTAPLRLVLLKAAPPGLSGTRCRCQLVRVDLGCVFFEALPVLLTSVFRWVTASSRRPVAACARKVCQHRSCSQFSGNFKMKFKVLKHVWGETCLRWNMSEVKHVWSETCLLAWACCCPVCAHDTTHCNTNRKPL